MTLNEQPLSIAAVLLLCCGISALAGGQAAQKAAKQVSGCEILNNPAKYNGEVIKVSGLVDSDFEHFDMRFKCPGYISFETSTRPDEISKYGFGTKQDGSFKRLLGATGKMDVGTNCLGCQGANVIVHASVTGLFRCHADFSDCAGISRFGDSSLVIRSVDSVHVEKARPGSDR